MSGNKLLALRDLARREEAGEIPDLRRMSTMSEDAIVEALVPTRGIGRWTVEMMLMFRLGRPDVLPIDDLGIRKGAQVVDGHEAMPTPKELAARGECWGPYRTYASLYLWPKVPAGYTAAEFADKSLLATGVSLTPGSAFGAHGEGYLRISLGQTTTRFMAAVERLREFKF